MLERPSGSFWQQSADGTTRFAWAEAEPAGTVSLPPQMTLSLGSKGAIGRCESVFPLSCYFERWLTGFCQRVLPPCKGHGLCLVLMPLIEGGSDAGAKSLGRNGQE
jgi:hypothetical protein